MKKLCTALLMAGLNAACGSANVDDAQNTSAVHFITFGPDVAGLVAKVKQKSISVCLSGISSANSKSWVDNISSSILKWVRPMRALTSEKLVETVDVRTDGRGCDTDVRVVSGTWANTQVGSRPVVNMDSSGYFASYNVLLHEFGHAFALSDTYISRSGECKPGQPQAVMCNTSFDDLQADDIAGMAKKFKETFPNDRPGSNPGQDPDPLQAIKVFAALGRESGSDSYHMHFAANLSTGKVTGMEICENSAQACNADGSFESLVPGTPIGGVQVADTAAAVEVAADKVITVRVTLDSGVKVLRSMRFARK